jgi:hypothetical protein
MSILPILSQLQPTGSDSGYRQREARAVTQKVSSGTVVSRDGDRWEPSTGSSEQIQRELQELQQRDREVRRSEFMKLQYAGIHALGPRFDFEIGPDGKAYAVEGDVVLDIKTEAGNPVRTAEKLADVKRALMMVPNPGPEVRRLAAEVARRELVARVAMRTDTSWPAEAPEPATRIAQPQQAGDSTNNPAVTAQAMQLRSFQQYKVERLMSPEYVYRRNAS